MKYDYFPDIPGRLLPQQMQLNTELVHTVNGARLQIQLSAKEAAAECLEMAQILNLRSSDECSTMNYLQVNLIGELPEAFQEYALQNSLFS